MQWPVILIQDIFAERAKLIRANLLPFLDVNANFTVTSQEHQRPAMADLVILGDPIRSADAEDNTSQAAVIRARYTLTREAWRARRATIEILEREFWQVGASPSSPADRFADYIEALLLDEQAGAARLRELAGDHPAYLVVHLSDALKLGALQPQRFGIGYRDFANSGQIHGLINRVKAWLHGQGHASYTVDASSAQTAKVYYLTDPAAAQTLLAQALSFSTANPLTLQTLQLVYQTGGFWVYKLSKTTG